MRITKTEENQKEEGEMKASAVSAFEFDYGSGSQSETTENSAVQRKEIRFIMAGETLSLVIGIIILLVGIVSSMWESGHQVEIIKAIEQTFI